MEIHADKGLLRLEVQTMSDTDENIVRSFGELRRFCRDVSLLLETAGSMMEEKGWTIAPPMRVFAASSALKAPDEWLPYEFCRFYTKSDFPNLLLFIAVNVGDPAEDHNGPMKYAILSAGCIAFKPGNSPAGTEHWWSRWHLFMKEDRRKDDGSICTDEPAKDWKRYADEDDPPAGISIVKTLAYRLTSIGNADSLESKIVDRLLEHCVPGTNER